MVTLRQAAEQALEASASPTCNQALQVAAQQALEALEWHTQGKAYIPLKSQSAITAIRAALAEQPAEQRPQNCGTGFCSCIECPYVQPAEQEPWTPRELELIDGMIDVQLNHAERCDHIANRTMAEKQKGWDMERVALLRKIRDTAPQPRREVELTDEEIDEVWNGLIATPDFSRVKIARSIIEAYKAKQGEQT